MAESNGNGNGSSNGNSRTMLYRILSWAVTSITAFLVLGYIEHAREIATLKATSVTVSDMQVVANQVTEARLQMVSMSKPSEPPTWLLNRIDELAKSMERLEGKLEQVQETLARMPKGS